MTRILDAMSSPAALLRRRLPLLPGPRFCVDVAAALMDTDTDSAGGALAELVDAALVEQAGPGRWQVSEPRREHITADPDTDDETARSTAQQRVLDHYLRHTAAVEETLAPGKRRFAPLYASPLPRFGDRAAANAWLAVEQGTVLAALALAEHLGNDELVWMFGEALRAGLRHTGGLEQVITVQQRAALAADRLTHPYAATGWAQVANAQSLLGHHDDALRSGAVALTRARSHGDHRSLSIAHGVLSAVSRAVGDPTAALCHTSHALDADRAREAPPATIGRRHQDRAQALSDLHRYGDAIFAAETAVYLIDTDPRLVVEAGRARTVLARVLLAAGSPDTAVQVLTQALPALLTAAIPLYPAEAHELLGHATTALGEHQKAREHYLTARQCFEAAGYPVHVHRLDTHLDARERPRPEQLA